MKAARNPEAESSLPYLVFVQIDGGTWLKARETWPCSSRVYCHPAAEVDVGALDVSSASPCSVVSGAARSSISSSTAGRTAGRSSASRARPADDLLADGESGREGACASCIVDGGLKWRIFGGKRWT
jgi:hypothetical protein